MKLSTSAYNAIELPKIKRQPRSIFRKQVTAILRQYDRESVFKHAFPEAVEALVELYPRP